jgi:hypothetical protein
MQTHVVYNGWYAFDGRFVTFDEVSHQHISNAIWFNEVFNNRTKSNDKFMRQVDWALTRRFNGFRLEWRPLPIPNEIETLRKMGLINSDGDIIFKGCKIGTINHIGNEEKN